MAPAPLIVPPGSREGQASGAIEFPNKDPGPRDITGVFGMLASSPFSGC
jgi:hypothetical protein